MPSCFGASPCGDAMYPAGRVLNVRTWLVDARFSMSFVIEVGSLRPDDWVYLRIHCGGHV